MIPKKMLLKAKEIALELKKKNDFVVIHHNDADGITAGAIAVKMLEREGKKVSAKWVKQLYKETIQEIKGLGKNYVFVDFGSGQLNELKKEFNEKNFFVFDHHQPIKIEHKFHFNPLLFGIDGGKELSGSGTVFLIALTLNEANIDLSPLAIIGASGDMQDFKGKLIGLNEWILIKAINAGLMKKEIDLRLYGRVSRPLVQFLMYSSNPILPQLTANEEKCIEFLKEKGFNLKKKEKWITYNDLNEKEKKELITELIIHLTSFGEPEWKTKELIGEVYSILTEPKNSLLSDVKEFSTLLNACGRHGRAEIGLKVCLGDRENAFEEAMDLLVIHKRELSEGIRFVQEKGIKEEKEFYFFDAEKKINETIVGIVAGMLYSSGIIESNKPIIAFARTNENEIKVSGRGTTELIRKGLNLGKSMKEISEEIEGQGGGHCLEKNSLIITENGFEKIESIKGKKTLSNKNNKINYENITKKFEKKVKEKIEIKTDLFRISSSKNHRFFKYEKEKMIEEFAENLKENDFILGCKKIEIPKKGMILKNNPFVYLKEKGIDLLIKKRKLLKLTKKNICESICFPYHTIKHLEDKKSHRIKEKYLLNLLKELKINEQNFYSKYIERKFVSKINKITPELARFLGYITGDGYIDKKRLEFKEPDKKIIEKQVKIIEKYFNPTIKIIPMKNYSKVRAYSADFCRYLIQNFPELQKTTHHVKTPEKIVFSEDKIISEFIGGLFDAEGMSIHHSIKISMTSEQILTETQLLLLNYDILSSLRKKKDIFDLEINDFESIKKFNEKIKFTKNSKKDLKLKELIKKLNKKQRNSNHFLPITLGEFIKKLKELNIKTNIFSFYLTSRGRQKRISKPLFEEKILPPIQKYLKHNKEKLKEFNKELEKFYPKNYFWCRIKKINKIKCNEKMFDLSVPKTKNYAANGLIVHNSIASGMKFPQKFKEKFMKLMNEKIEKQLSKRMN